jgi:hypothetical protein
VICGKNVTGRAKFSSPLNLHISLEILSSWRRVFLEKLIVSQLVNILSAGPYVDYLFT